MINYDILNQTELFRGIDDCDLTALLGCLGAKSVKYGKSETVLPVGEPLHAFGIVISGLVQVVQDDFYGNRSILGVFGPGEIFGESFAFSESKELPVSVIAVSESEILFIDCHRIETPCANACAFHAKLIRNMMNDIAKKNVALTRKIGFTSKRTTREKLLAYLSSEAQKKGSSSFAIPFSRQELADYLSVDRSAMSAELSKMRDDGILTFRKNEFELL